MLEDKNKIRKIYAEKRANMATSEVDSHSSLIMKQLLALPEYQRSNTIHTFIGSLPGEVRTKPFIEHALSDNKDVIVPIYHGINEPPSHSKLHNIDSLVVTQFGIEQPETDSILSADISDADLIIVPCLAVDKNGNRLGMGGGFYDRILTGLSKTKIALVYEFQIADNLPSEEHDVQMNIIISEKDVYHL